MQQDLTLLAQFYKSWDWIENNRKQAAQIAVGLVIAGLIAGYYFWSRGEKEIKAGEAVSQVTLNAAVEGQSPQATADAYLKVESKYRGSIAAASALLQAGVAKFQGGDYPGAQTLFERMQHEYSSSPLVPQAILGQGSCLEAQGKQDEALRIYKMLTDRYPASNVVPQAKYSQARIFEAQGKLKEAYGIYEEVVNVMGLSSSVGSEAGIRGAELERKLRMGAPATAPAPAPVAPSGLTSFSLTASTNMLLGKTNTP